MGRCLRKPRARTPARPLVAASSPTALLSLVFLVWLSVMSHPSTPPSPIRSLLSFWGSSSWWAGSPGLGQMLRPTERHLCDLPTCHPVQPAASGPPAPCSWPQGRSCPRHVNAGCCFQQQLLGPEPNPNPSSAGKAMRPRQPNVCWGVCGGQGHRHLDLVAACPCWRRGRRAIYFIC